MKESAVRPRFFYVGIQMVNITLPDGSVRKYEEPVSVGEIAASIGPGSPRPRSAAR
jgi:threonyl-tRNA synthetase